MKLSTKIKGFTIAELLVTMVLTSIAITFAYSTLSYIQKLFHDYRAQNNFISEVTNLRSVFHFESLKCESIVQTEQNSFDIRRNNNFNTLLFNEKYILLRNDQTTDTFHFSAKDLKIQYEKIDNPKFQNKLANNIEFEVFYSKQIFRFRLSKEYNSDIKIYYNTLED